MSETRKHVGLGAALSADAEMRYAQEVASLSSLPPKQAQIEAVKIMRRLAGSFWHQPYGSYQARERFDALWVIAFPEEEKGGKK